MKEIRASTGLALPVAKIAARMVFKKEPVFAFYDKGFEINAKDLFHCNDCQVMHREYFLVGPSGEFQI